MKYSICIIKNRLNKQLDLKKYLVDWFTKYTPLEIETNVIETDFDVTTEHAGNDKVKGVIVGGDIIPKLKTIIPEGKYNCVLFIYGNDLQGIRVSACSGSLYPDTEFIQTFQYKDGGKVANHELFHAFFQKARKCQINIIDPMDTYLRDSELQVDSLVNTNRELALQLLTPHWDKICAFRNLKEEQQMAKYKYFNEKDDPKMIGVNPKLMTILDLIREDCKFPITITSGFRTKEENAKLKGSVEDSAHLLGLAVDININTSAKRIKFIESALKNGIRRIGLKDTFCHIDIDSSKPDSIWFY